MAAARRKMAPKRIQVLLFGIRKFGKSVGMGLQIQKDPVGGTIGSGWADKASSLILCVNGAERSLRMCFNMRRAHPRGCGLPAGRVPECRRNPRVDSRQIAGARDPPFGILPHGPNSP